jgi:hypothetical protein
MIEVLKQALESVYEFAFVHHTLEHIEIVNITKNPPDLDRYTYLEVRRPESPSIKIYCLKEHAEDVIQFYTKD